MPASSGSRSSPPSMPSAGRPTIVLFGLSHKKDAGPVGVEQPRRRLGHAHEQRFHFVRLMPVVRDGEDRLQAFELRSAARSRCSTIGERVRQAVRDCGEAVARTVAADEQHVLGFGGDVRRDRAAVERRGEPAIARRQRRRVPAPRRPVRAARPTRPMPRTASIDPIRRRGASDRGRLGARGREHEVERRFEQVGDVGNLAGQVEQVRYDVWHWRWHDGEHVDDAIGDASRRRSRVADSDCLRIASVEL